MTYKYTDKKGEHLHSLDGKPLIGTSTVCKLIGKGDILTWWASGMACERFGWMNPKRNNPIECGKAIEEARMRILAMSPSEYEKHVTEAYRAWYDYRSERAKIGKARHEELEMYVKECLKENGTVIAYQGNNKYVIDFWRWATKNIKRFLWSEMHCYSEELWTGGIVDVGWVDIQGRVIVGDFKSGKEAYFDQWLQAAAYAYQIEDKGGYTAEGEKIFDLEGEPVMGLCIVPFGADEFDPALCYDVRDLKNGFKSLLEVYKLNQAYDS